MNKRLFSLFLCLLMAVAFGSGMAESASNDPAEAYTFSVTYIEKNLAFTDGTYQTPSGPLDTVDFEVEKAKSKEGFIGWSSLPNGLADYVPGDTIKLAGANRHATLYAVYENTDTKRFVIEYITNGHYRHDHYLSDSNTYTAYAADGYIEGFKGWSLTAGGDVDYRAGSELVLQKPAEITLGKSVYVTPSLTLYAVLEEDAGSFRFVVNYVCENHQESITLPASLKTPVCYFPLNGPEAMQSGDPYYENIIGWSEKPGGSVNYAVGATLTMQYNVPEKTLYAVRNGEAPAEAEPPVEAAPPADTEIPGEQDEPVWGSENEQVVTVDASAGVVRAAGVGQTEVTVEWQGAKASVRVIVEEPYESSLPLQRDLTNEGVKPMENKEIAYNSVVRTNWATTSGGDAHTPTRYYYCEDGGWMTPEQMQSYFGADYGDWVYELPSKVE